MNAHSGRAVSIKQEDRLKLDLSRREAWTLFQLAQDNLHERTLKFLYNRKQTDAAVKSVQKLTWSLTLKDYTRSASGRRSVALAPWA